MRLALVSLALLLAPAAAAHADVTLAEGPPVRGYVHLVAAAAPMADDLRIVEVVDGADVGLDTMPSAFGVEAQARWSCTTTRTFAAIAGGERSAPLTVTTPACTSRFRVAAPQVVRLGEDMTVSVRDRWHVGDVEGDVCAVRPNGLRACRHFAMPAGQYIADVVAHASHAGEWRFEVLAPEQTSWHPVRVVRRRPGAGEPTVLATGDSMMLSTTRAIRRRLSGSARTVADIYVGSGITRPFVIDWAKLPAQQVRVYRPDAVVVSLGMGDGRDIQTPAGTAVCCGPDYVAAYAARVRTIMRTYERGGRGAVVWLNEPFQRDPARRPEEAAVNAAVALAAQGRPRVRVVDLATALTPGGTYRRSVVRDGRRVRVRTDDGIHLAVGGARIAARLTARALRRLGVGVAR